MSTPEQKLSALFDEAGGTIQLHNAAMQSSAMLMNHRRVGSDLSPIVQKLVSPIAFVNFLQADHMHKLTYTSDPAIESSAMDGVIDFLVLHYVTSPTAIISTEKTPVEKLVELLGTMRSVAETGYFLLTLDDESHTRAEVERAIDLLPCSILVRDPSGLLPIQRAIKNKHGSSFIPFLAEKGIPQHAGGEGQRGGLLCSFPGYGYGSASNMNLIQLLCALHGHANGNDLDVDTNINMDRRYQSILQSLHVSNLLVKEDVMAMNLLEYSSHISNQRRFRFLASLNPSALRLTRCNGIPLPLLHHAITSTVYAQEIKIENFKLVLTTAMKHFPNEMGFLFNKAHHNGKTAFETAIDEFGIDVTAECLIPFKSSIPDSLRILSEVQVSCPHRAKEFIRRYNECYP